METMDGKSNLWSESLESYKKFSRFKSETSEKVRNMIRARFPDHSKIFDAIDKEVMK